MSSGYFKIKAHRKLSEMKVGERIDTSDYATLTPDGSFVQMEYIEEDDTREKIPTHVRPGIFSMKKSMAGMYLEETKFNQDKILEDFVVTSHIENKVDSFFNKINVYQKLEIENIKRAALIFGPPGTGKTTMVSKTCTKYGNDGKTLVLVWHTDTFEAGEVKGFVQSFEYQKHGVSRMILVAEDIGGSGAEQTRMRSDSSLLSLLDNKEKTFRVPVFILATTNFPEMFQENVTDRPERFDDKIEAPHPKSDAREALFNFFSKISPAEPAAMEKLKSKACDKFSPAHIREIVIRSALYDKTQLEVINELIAESAKYQKGFAKNGGSVGFGA